MPSPTIPEPSPSLPLTCSPTLLDQMLPSKVCVTMTIESCLWSDNKIIELDPGTNVVRYRTTGGQGWTGLIVFRFVGPHVRFVHVRELGLRVVHEVVVARELHGPYVKFVRVINEDVVGIYKNHMWDWWGWSIRLWWGTYNTRIACEVREGGTWCFGGGPRRTTCEIRESCPWNFGGEPTVMTTRRYAILHLCRYSHLSRTLIQWQSKNLVHFIHDPYSILISNGLGPLLLASRFALDHLPGDLVRWRSEQYICFCFQNNNKVFPFQRHTAHPVEIPAIPDMAPGTNTWLGSQTLSCSRSIVSMSSKQSKFISMNRICLYWTSRPNLHQTIRVQSG